MSRKSEFLEEFRASMEDLPLPERLGAYRLDGCLSRSPGTGEGGPEGVWLLRRRSDGAPFILKVSREENAGLPEEFEAMKRLPEDLPVPRGVDCFREDGAWYLVRTYLPGQSLADLPVPHRRCGETGIALCALLERLHGLDPPIIHRDIKPENIILAPDGTVGLIDFGIARSYKPGRETDTVMMGTRATAAPEQYGFAQSDQRTDLYALGVTLRWMASGSYAPEALESAPCSRRLKRCLRRAAAFSPEDRFPSARAFGAALKRAVRPLWAALLPLALLLAAAVGLGTWLGLREREVRFDNPLLEAAVRYELETPEGPIYPSDLERVERLALVGREVLRDEQVYECRLHSYVDNVPIDPAGSGDVEDLSLLAQMPNLQVLYLCHQEISDLAPLAELPLRELYLTGNRLQDLEPLGEITSLEVLFLGENPAADFSPLASLYGLRTLNLDRTAPESLGFLPALYVGELSLAGTLPGDGDWSHLSRASALWRVLLWDPPEAALEALAEAELLAWLNMGDYGGADLRALDMPRLTVLGLFGGELTLEGVERMTNLEHLDLCNLGDVDLTPVQALPGLVWFSSYNCGISDYGPLAGAPALAEVCLDGPGLERFYATCPAYGFQVIPSP